MFSLGGLLLTCCAVASDQDLFFFSSPSRDVFLDCFSCVPSLVSSSYSAVLERLVLIFFRGTALFRFYPLRFFSLCRMSSGAKGRGYFPQAQLSRALSRVFFPPSFRFLSLDLLFFVMPFVTKSFSPVISVSPRSHLRLQHFFVSFRDAIVPEVNLLSWSSLPPLNP